MDKVTKISDTKKNVLSIFLIAALATIIYSNSFYASFHFDDTPAIVENYAIHRFDLKEIFSTSSRPILDLTFALNYYFGKLNVFGYHLVNLMLHIANGVMLYFILFWTINPKGRGQRAEGKEQRANNKSLHAPCSMLHVKDSINFRIPLYASLIFIAHPIQTQAVTYIVSRSSVLATTFYLLAMLLFIKSYRQNMVTVTATMPVSVTSNGNMAKPNDVTVGRNGLRNPNRRTYIAKLYLLGAFLASCLGMGTKQEAATLPLILLIYDFYFISDGDWKMLKGHYKVHLAMFSTLASVLYLSFSGLKTYISFDYAKGVPMPQEGTITSFQYFLTQLHVIPYYIKLLFIPTNLNLDYDWPITKEIDFTTALFFVLLTSIIVIAIKLFRRTKLISFGIIWFFVTLSVTSSFVVIYDVIFEHRLYLPSVGFAVVIAFMISKISEIRQRSLVTGQQSMTNN